MCCEKKSYTLRYFRAFKKEFDYTLSVEVYTVNSKEKNYSTIHLKNAWIKFMNW